jgi:hypothetical protein
MHRDHDNHRLDHHDRLANLEKRLAIIESHNGHDLDAYGTRLALIEATLRKQEKGWARVATAFYEALVGLAVAYLLFRFGVGK